MVFIAAAINLHPWDRHQLCQCPAPAQGRYFLLTSGCSGWDPNRAEVFSAPAMEGPWDSLGDPCRDGDPAACATFFRSQSELGSTGLVQWEACARRSGHTARLFACRARLRVSCLATNRRCGLPGLQARLCCLWLQARARVTS